ncbi:hypothetical protein [Heyndrickxia sporothermodurans]|uniref:hypothetical protein n=1 Tax=Heyndrickxia sporothermodurans TaxID=46224 RepID=UPI0008243E44|nr:hypothetical protein [Heyndrickxia sporothermodurans]
MPAISLSVQYFNSLDISLDESMPGDFFNNYCDRESGERLISSEIDPTNLHVSLDGQLLTADQYILQDNKVVLKQNMISTRSKETEFYFFAKLFYTFGKFICLMLEIKVVILQH